MLQESRRASPIIRGVHCERCVTPMKSNPVPFTVPIDPTRIHTSRPDHVTTVPARNLSRVPNSHTPWRRLFGSASCGLSGHVTAPVIGPCVDWFSTLRGARVPIVPRRTMCKQATTKEVTGSSASGVTAILWKRQGRAGPAPVKPRHDRLGRSRQVSESASVSSMWAATRRPWRPGPRTTGRSPVARSERIFQRKKT